MKSPVLHVLNFQNIYGTLGLVTIFTSTLTGSYPDPAQSSPYLSIIAKQKSQRLCGECKYGFLYLVT
jgi:hypothetical protein